MASAWITRRQRATRVSYVVRYRSGGRETLPQNGGSFRTMREARLRRDWIAGELASGRLPDLRLLEVETVRPTFRELAERWQESRIDVSAATASTHTVNLGRVLEHIGDRPVDEINPVDVAHLVAVLHERGLARESLRKTISTVAQVFDFAGIQPNPARDRKTVRLPQETREEVAPPIATHVATVIGLLPKPYRLPAVVIDACGFRVSEVEALRWGDADEPGRRLRVSRASSKTRRSRWVPVPAKLFGAIAALVPREDRDLEAQVFDGFRADAFRTALARSCKAAGLPLISPHDLRHRRATLWHLSGVPAAEAAAWLGHSSVEHLRTYAHASLLDRTEVEYGPLLAANQRTSLLAS